MHGFRKHWQGVWLQQLPRHRAGGQVRPVSDRSIHQHGVIAASAALSPPVTAGHVVDDVVALHVKPQRLGVVDHRVGPIARQQRAAILELQRASKFIPTKATNYKGIEAAAKEAGLLQ